jgi:hypothetical protein
MQKLALPPYTAEYTFSTCISRINDANLKSRLSSIKATIIAAAVDYEGAARQNALYTIGTSDTVNGVVSTIEMSDVYDLRMARKLGPGRHIYDKLISAPAYGRCPLCGQGKVWTLDHHLPKKQYPVFAVAPANLIPSCQDCNKAKGSTVPTTPEDSTLHPYFDYIDAHLWLTAAVVETDPAAVLFSISRPAAWEDILFARVRYHFKLFNLASLYSGHAAEEMSNIRDYVSRLHASAGLEGVRQHLRDQANSREASRRNSWQSATYRALEANDWYCNGGFDLNADTNPTIDGD